MNIKRLNIGILIREVTPCCILSLNGQFFMDKNNFCKGLNLYDIVLFEGGDNGIVFAMEISHLRYFNLQLCYNDANDPMSSYSIYIPEKCLQLSDSFIVDYGLNKYNIVIKTNECLYINYKRTYYDKYSELESLIIKSSIKKKKKEIEAIRIESIKPNKHPFPSVGFAEGLKKQIEPININPLEDKIFHREDELNKYYEEKAKKENAERKKIEELRRKDPFLGIIINEDALLQFIFNQDEEEKQKLKRIGCGYGEIRFFDGFENTDKEINTVIREVNDYLSTLNVNEVLNSFTITNEELFMHRAGRDDCYYVTKCSKEFDDGYINSLFPQIHETIYRDSAYTVAEDLRIDIEKRPYRNEEVELINKAKELYNKDEHRTYLLDKYLSRYFNEQVRIVRAAIREQEEYYQDIIKSRAAFLNRILTLLQEGDCTELIANLNKEMSNYRYKNKIFH